MNLIFIIKVEFLFVVLISALANRSIILRNNSVSRINSKLD